MYQRAAILHVPDRPARYVRVPCDVEASGGELVFRLPDERVQLALLQYVRERFGSENVSGGVMIRNLDALAAVVAVCWHHPVLGLSCVDDFGDVRDLLSDDAAMFRALDALGQLALEELDDADLGSHRTIGPAFARVTGAMSRSFLGQEVVDERLGFTAQPPASGG